MGSSSAGGAVLGRTWDATGGRGAGGGVVEAALYTWPPSLPCGSPARDPRP